MNQGCINEASDFIGGRFLSIAGDALESRDPADPARVIWRGSPRAEHVDDAVSAARAALPAWSATALEERVAAIKRWQMVVRANVERLASLITDEMGKVISESRVEAKALADKVDITLGEHSQSRVREYEVTVSASRIGRCRYKPHGVVAVIGPFNFPAHLPNGHFVPALLMGDTVVFKPSDKTPAVGQMLAELMHEADLPPGVFNLVQGKADIASRLVSHEGVDGILFTGSWPIGRRILEANLDHPGRIIALEMGGNNPAVIMPDCDVRQAVIESVRACFATTGQRCTCTRRIIVHHDVAGRFMPAFVEATKALVIGPGHGAEGVFMGPVVNESSADAVVKFQRDLSRRGGTVLLEATRPRRSGWFITPGISQVDGFSLAHDVEVFGPFAQVTIVKDLTEAIKQANASRYGLAAAIFTRDDAEFESFFHGCRAGCINRNTGTAGASSMLPFGGLGRSGNHRPAGAFSVDYCAYPVASMVERGHEAALSPGMSWDDQWIAAPAR